MSKLGQLWGASLLFRRLTAASVFVLTSLLVYLGSHIPRAISLPADDLNAKAVARIKEEQIVITQPVIAQGNLALSYTGNKNEIADLWVENATLDERSRHLLFGSSPPPPPQRISYTTGGTANVKNSGDTCHTTIEIRRAQDSPPIDSLVFSQTDQTAGAQRFRQIVLDPGPALLEIEVHTDSPGLESIDLPACHKLLTIGNSIPVDLPPIPIHILVHGGGKIDLHFNPANPALPIWTGADQTFEAVSLGDGSLLSSRVQVVPTVHAKKPSLDVRSSPPSSVITLNRLKLGSEVLKLDIGRDSEKAVAYAKGESLYNYDLVAEVQKNPILGFAFAAVLVPALWKWIRRNCFPNMTE